MGRDIQSVVPSPVFGPGVTAHFRVTVTNTATDLEDLQAISTINSTVKPTGMYLAVELGQTNSVFFTFDGQSTPAAALGYVVPLQPLAPVYIPFGRQGYQDGLVKLIAPAGNTYVQVKFDWDSSVG